VGESIWYVDNALFEYCQTLQILARQRVRKTGAPSRLGLRIVGSDGRRQDISRFRKHNAD